MPTMKYVHPNTFAHAMMTAIELHEASYVKEQWAYSRDWMDCVVAACEQHYVDAVWHDIIHDLVCLGYCGPVDWAQRQIKGETPAPQGWDVITA